jgi:multiple sugar transport system permease protein
LRSGSSRTAGGPLSGAVNAPAPRAPSFDRNRAAAIYLIGPAALFTVALIGFPFLFTVWIALHDWVIGGSGARTFVGLANVATMLHDAQFWQSLGVTLALAIPALAVETVVGVYVGLLLDRGGWAVRLLRAAILFPSVIPSVAAGMVWLVLMDPSLGLLNLLLRAAHLGPWTWIDSPRTVIPSLILIDVWQWTPFVALIVLGGLQALPRDPYEAARIDGASDWQVFRHLTLPLLEPVLWVAVMLRSVDLLRIFDTIYVMTQGGPGTASTSLNIYAYQQGFQYFHVSYAAVLMLALLAVVVLFNVGIHQASRRSR